MEVRFHGRGTALPRPEPAFRCRIDPVPHPPSRPVESAAGDGTPLHPLVEPWYEHCQQFPPNGETNTNNPEREKRMTARTQLPQRCDELLMPVPGSDWLRAEDGQDLAEYAILVGLIALVVVGAVTLFGGQLVAAYNAIASTLPFG